MSDYGYKKYYTRSKKGYRLSALVPVILTEHLHDGIPLDELLDKYGITENTFFRLAYHKPLRRRPQKKKKKGKTL